MVKEQDQIHYERSETKIFLHKDLQKMMCASITTLVSESPHCMIEEWMIWNLCHHLKFMIMTRDLFHWDLQHGLHWRANDLEIGPNVFITVNNYFSDYLTIWNPPNRNKVKSQNCLPNLIFFVSRALPGSPLLLRVEEGSALKFIISLLSPNTLNEARDSRGGH